MGSGTDIAPDLGLLPAWLLVEINNKQCQQRTLIRCASLVGRAAGADVRLRHPKVSNAHCLIVNDGRGLSVRDLGSREGIAINGRCVDAGELHDANILRIGPFRLRIVVPEEQAAEDNDRPQDDLHHEVEEARQELAELARKKQSLEAEWALEAEWLEASRNAKAPHVDTGPPRSN